ncbi:ABC transporter permease [Clostridium sporogenes]|uniref:ABC transporter permease n=1 Tax=Clostridium sporogenes TaxID=1509 RepID=UPI003DA6BA4D
MERALKVITLDIKRKGFLKNLMVSLLSMICFLFLSGILLKQKITTIPEILLNIIPYFILASYSLSLTQEFANKTDKIVFTGIFSRNEIMISKLINFIVTCIICFVCYEITSIICNTFNLGILFNNLQTFIIYAFTLGSFILLVSVITSNFIITGIVGYVFYFDLILTLFKQALCSNRSEVLKKIIENSPFYIANTGFYIGKYTTHQSLIMISSGVIFLVAACVIINRKNM